MRVTSLIVLSLLGTSLASAGLATESFAQAIASPAVDATTRSQLDGALATRKAGDPVGAVRLLKPLAENGVTEAEYEMGTSYQYGLGVCKDTKIAAEWLLKAASKNYAPAQRQLGYLYTFSTPFINEPDSEKTAESWFLKAALQGDIQSQVEIGDINSSDSPTPDQYRTAAGWYEKAAAQGSTRAMASLGRLYRRGFGVKQDYAKAFEWYKKAADKDETEGQAGLGDMYENGLGVAKNDVEAYVWYRLAGSNSHGSSSDSMENVNRVKALLTSAQIETAEARVKAFRVSYPGTEWNGAIPVPPVRARNGCDT